MQWGTVGVQRGILDAYGHIGMVDEYRHSCRQRCADHRPAGSMHSMPASICTSELNMATPSLQRSITFMHHF